MTPTMVSGVPSRSPASGPSVLSVMVRPRMLGSLWKYRCHARALMTTTFEPAAASAGSSVRPSCARAPSIAKVFGDISDPVRRADPDAVGISVIGGVIEIAIAESVLVLLRHWLSSACDMSDLRSSGAEGLAGAARCTIRTRRSESLYGSGSSSTVLTTLNTAVAAPMPRASVITAAAVKPGLRTRPRIAYDTSLARSSRNRLSMFYRCYFYNIQPLFYD